MKHSENNPLVSFCIITYNQEKYIQKAIKGVLNQTYSPLEIIISDDCSTDKTFDIIKQTVEGYHGPHKIILNKNNKNMGIGGHVSKVFYDLANGNYIICAAGDDISKKEHAVEAVRYMEMNPNINMIDFSADIIDKKDTIIRSIKLDFGEKTYTITDFLNLKKVKSFAPGRIIRKSFLLFFDPISNNCPTEDSVLVIRSYLTGGFMRVNKSLVYYRQHDSNISNFKGLRTLSNHAIISQYIRDILLAYEKGIISENIYEQMLDRVCLELKIRKLIYSGSSGKIYMRVKDIFVKFLKLCYLLKKNLCKKIEKTYLCGGMRKKTSEILEMY